MDVFGVSGTGEMGVDASVFVRVQVHKHFQDELLTGKRILLGT